MRLSREQVRPQVDAFANLTAAGLAGQPALTGTNPLAAFFPPGTVLTPPLLVGGYGTSLSNLAGGNFPTAQVGLQVSLPLRNRTAEARQAISVAEGRRLRALQDQVAMAVEADVRNALQAVESARSRWMRPHWRAGRPSNSTRANSGSFRRARRPCSWCCSARRISSRRAAGRFARGRIWGKRWRTWIGPRRTLEAHNIQLAAH